MPKRVAHQYQIGEFYLSQRADTGGWYVCRYDKRRRCTVRERGPFWQLDEATGALAEHALSVRPKAGPVGIGAVLLYWYDNHAIHNASAPQALRSLQVFTAFMTDQGISETDPVDVLKPPTFREFAAWRRRMGATPKVGAKDTSWRPVSGNTISRNLADVRAALKFAEKEELIPRAPFVPDVRSEDRNGPKTLRLSIRDMGRLYHGADEHMQDYLLILMATWCRPEAGLELTREQCDFDRRVIHVNPEGRSQTKKFRPSVPMCQAFYDRFHTYPPGPLVTVEFGKADESGKRKRRSVKSIRTAFRRLRLLLDLDPAVEPKTIRYSMATLARNSARYRLSPWEVQGMLGHAARSSSANTTEGYAAWDPAESRNVATVIDRLIRDLRSGCDPKQVRSEMDVVKDRLFPRPYLVELSGIEPLTSTMPLSGAGQKPQKSATSPEPKRANLHVLFPFCDPVAIRDNNEGDTQ